MSATAAASSDSDDGEWVPISEAPERQSPEQDSKSGRKDGTPRSSSAESDDAAANRSASPPPPPTSERKGLFVLGIAFLVLWLLFSPLLLHKAGVIEQDPKDAFDAFLQNASFLYQDTVLPTILDKFHNHHDANYTNPEHASNERLRPGYKLSQLGAAAKHPVIIVPGFVTSGLELWQGEDCAKKHFRQRLWGSVSMARTFFADRECWRRHLSLDPRTGLDPPNIRIRSAQGFEAADYFMATYWVWSKLIENLADVGYDGSSMQVMPYDWRLAYHLMEERDGYFTKLMYTIEAFHRSTGEKVVLVSHSMGGTVVQYFFAWVCADIEEGGGGGGRDWVETHVHTFVNIAGTLLGVPKAIPALLSGELKDTAALLSQIGSLLETYFGKRLRRDLWTTWGSLFGMLPKGGDAIWGVGADLIRKEERGEERKGGAATTTPMIVVNQTLACDAAPSSDTDDIISDSSIVGGECKSPMHALPSSSEWSTEDTVDYILKSGGGDGDEPLSSSRLFSFDNDISKNPSATHEKWHNPISTPLPHAPSLKIYCMYGTGIATERAFYYKRSCDKHDSSAAQGSGTCSESFNYIPIVIDTSVEDLNDNITYGVKFSDGDGSVPLLSLGYMCEHWKTSKSHNPSGVKVVTREHQHKGEFTLEDPGHSGPYSGEHVDILGHLDVMEDVVKIATDFESESVTDRIISDLERIVSEIDGHLDKPLDNA